MFSSQQEGIRSGAQVEGLYLSRTVDSSSKLTGEKAEYMGIDVDRWVDAVMGVCKSYCLISSIFSGK